ncbi:MAG: class I SAM-dependent methyltransferase [Acidobacteriaceae bacterium]|nr:class I SAM-dependent methyltransferase [Acidobacteriaceae bacterium]
MDRSDLYDKMADRKMKPKDFEPYDGHNGRVNKAVNLIRQGKLRNSGTLLDVGGGIGDLGYAVRDLFSNRITMDISFKSLEAAVAKGNFGILADVDKEGFGSGVHRIPDTTVDLICALDFIEHIVDPEHFARECYRVLKPSGEVFINTPNIRYWKHIDQLWRAGRFPHTSGDREVYHGGHLAFYTYSDLREIFEPAGFTSVEQIKDEEGYHNPPSPYVDGFKLSSQQEYARLMLELGCPNLLYKAIVTK